MQEYHISGDEKRVIWITSDDQELCIGDVSGKEDEEKLDSEVSMLFDYSEDFSTLVYGKGSELYVMTDFENRERISDYAWQVGVEDIDGDFKVYYVKDVNAFACADGSVRVFSSLMDIMSDEELLGVIGHEIGHVAHRDSKKGFRTALLTSALKDGVASQGGKLAELTDSQLGSLTEALVNARFSQKQECEADDYGYEFLKKAGKNPWSMALSFQKLKELQGQSGDQLSSKLNQLFSTHPDLDLRIKRMEERANNEGIEKPVIK